MRRAKQQKNALLTLPRSIFCLCRLQRLLAERLEQCGWRDQVAALARDALAGNYHPASPSLPRPHTADALAAHLRPAARAAVPDGIKAELLAELRAAVLAATTGTRAPTAETTTTT